VRDKLGAAFGSYGWSGEAINMIEDRLRGLKLRVPIKGVRARLIPTEEELNLCRDLGKQLSQHLTGQIERKIISMSELLNQEPTHA
jgi:flavorubredoxin